MTSRDMTSLKERLLARKERIEKNISEAMNEMSAMRAQDPKDEGDHASLAVGADIDAAIMDQQQKELNEIKLALDKMEKGTYGICELCEDYISIERLNVKPYARYCIACREITEKEHH